ncbi:hypothetical protein SEA_MIEK_79 [Streptomyces phage Miek]|nr:hypothetical protein SEA_SENDITCS_77 [Streptomyces phage SendItCS]WIC89416.1 hypothetical protein SEA_MIEK_79 [Streptomyces phage Miek]
MRELFQHPANDLPALIKFMQGPDNATLVRLISFFSRDSRYCHPRELKLFWESLSESEKNYYRRLVAIRFI